MFAQEIMQEQEDWFDIIYGKDLKGFIKMRSGKMQRFANIENLRDKEKFERQINAHYFTKNNFFVSLCSYKTTENGSQKNLSGIQGFQIDIDFRKIAEFKDYSHNQIIWMLKEDFFNRELPIPNLIERGNNLRLIYIFKSVVGATKKSVALVNKIIAKFTDEVAFLGGDKQTINSMIRLPGSINTKTGAVVETEIHSTYKYELSEMMDGWLDDYKKKKYYKNGNVITLAKTTKSLNYSRIKDLDKLVELRDKEMKGCRANFFFIYSSTLMSMNYDEKSMAREVVRVNKGFREPIPNVLTKINKKPFRFKNETIIEKLSITKDEMKYMTTIIDKGVKADRRSEKRKETYIPKTACKKKQDKTLAGVKKGLAEGLKQIEIAEKLKISLPTVKKYAKIIKDGTII